MDQLTISVDRGLISVMFQSGWVRAIPDVTISAIVLFWLM
jgi:hypothetical protein